MKCNIIILILVALSGCTGSTEKARKEINMEWSKYENAMSIDDIQVAKSAVYNIIALDSNNHSYYDTLAKLYFLTKEYESANKCASKALAFNMSEPTLALAYNCAKSLKNNKDVILYGKELLKINEDSIPIMYELSFNYLQLNDLFSAEKILNEVILSPKSLTQIYSEYRGNGVQKIAYRAAAYNLLGFIYNERLDKQNALGMFNAALMVQKDYVLAKENFDALTIELNAMDSTFHSSQ
jgi:tetratricopeptide (TPR) repeat protein